jgi:type IV pilus assembly protein PilC
VEGGSTFAAALKQHPKVFTSLYANMVEAGEAGGILDTILNRLAQYMEKAMALKKKVKSAMIYPSTIVTVAVVVVIFLLVFVIPTFKAMFEGFGAALPLPTQIVLELSRLVQAYFLVGLGVIVAAILGIRWWYGTPSGKINIDRFLLRLPVFGTLIRKVAVAKFTRTLGTLISSGVAILDGLEITARTAGNKVVEMAVLRTRASIAEGKTIAEPLRESGVFPPMVVQMIAVGEQTGALDAMLGKIADFLRRGGGHRRGEPHRPAGAHAHGVPGCGHRRCGHRHVSADLQARDGGRAISPSGAVFVWGSPRAAPVFLLGERWSQSTMRSNRPGPRWGGSRPS